MGWRKPKSGAPGVGDKGAVAGDEDTCHAPNWSGAKEHKLELMQRYKASAERAFYRSLEALRRVQKDWLQIKPMIVKNDAELGRLRAREKTRQEQGTLEQAMAEPLMKGRTTLDLIGHAHLSRRR